MNAPHFLRHSAAIVLSVAVASACLAQSADKMATIHGHAQNPVGQPIVGASVFALAAGEDPTDAKYATVTDANGDYKLEKLPAGSYSFVLQDKSQKDTKKVVDQTDLAPVAGGAETTVNFDLTRAEFLAKLPPEERAKIEAAKAKNAAANSENKKISNLNGILKQERDARAAKNYDQATTLATQITEGKPEAAVGWLELGMNQDLTKKYDAAIPNLQKALTLNAANAKPTPDITRVANTYLGDALLNTNKTDPAVSAYDAAAAVDATKAAGIYSDAAVLAYNKNNSDLTVKLADKAIAADPKDSQAYYLKGQALVGQATTDKAGKIITPPGCVESYQKYLEVDPNGAHAAEVQAVLQGLGAKISNSYKAGKK